jgi:hypothetical protein
MRRKRLPAVAFLERSQPGERPLPPLVGLVEVTAPTVALRRRSCWAIYSSTFDRLMHQTEPIMKNGIFEVSAK